MPFIRGVAGAYVVAPAVALVAVIALNLPALYRSEGHLRAAAEACQPVAEVRAWMQQTSTGTVSEQVEARQRAMELIASLANAGEPAAAVMPRVEREAITRAEAELAQVRGWGERWSAPAFVVLREQSRLMLQLSALDKAAGREPDAVAATQAAVRLADSAVYHEPSASSYLWYATVLARARAAGVTTPHLTTPEVMAEAEWNALYAAQSNDPHNPLHAQRALALAESQRWAERIPVVARALIRLDDLQRLDRETRGLPPEERRRVEGLAK